MPRLQRHRRGAHLDSAARVERAEARALLSEASRRRRSMTASEAERLYDRLERAKRRLESHHGRIGESDERSLTLERRITRALSRLGPIMRGKTARRDPADKRFEVVVREPGSTWWERVGPSFTTRQAAVRYAATRRAHMRTHGGVRLLYKIVQVRALGAR